MIGVDTEIVTLIVADILAADNTFLTHIAKRHRISGDTTTTGHTKCVTLNLGIVLEHRIHPISIYKTKTTAIFGIVVNALKAIPIVRLSTRIDSSFVHDCHILMRVEHVGLASC